MKKGLKIAFLCGALVLGGACFTTAYVSASTRESNIVMVRAEGEITSSQEVVTETSTEQEEKTIKEEIIEWKDTYLVPLLSGVSVTSIVSLVFTVILTIVREKRFGTRDKDLKERSSKAELLISEANMKIAEANEVICMIKETFEAIKTVIIKDEEIRKLLEEKFKTMEKMLADNNAQVSKIQKIEPILKLLIQLEAKVAKTSQNAIASGIIEDVNQLVKLAKEL